MRGALFASTAGFPALAVRWSEWRMASPWPTTPAAISLTPLVPLSTVRLAPFIPRAAASASVGRFSTMRLAAISSWLPSRSEAARAVLASACA